MTNPVTIAAIFLGPLLVILIVFLASQAERRRRAAAPEPGFFQRNGAPVAIFLVVAVGFWALFLIVFPQLYMIDYSFHPNLPQNPPRMSGMVLDPAFGLDQVRHPCRRP